MTLVDDQVTNQRRADEPRSAGDKDAHQPSFIAK